MRLRLLAIGASLLAASACSGAGTVTWTAPRGPVPPASSTGSTPTCTTYDLSPRPAGDRGGPRLELSVPFKALPEPFSLGGTSWETIPVTSASPIAFGVTLGHDAGVLVTALSLVVKPAGYTGGDTGLKGAVFATTWSQVRPAGQVYRTTFKGLDDRGRLLPPGLYKVMVNITAHRTSPSTCTEKGPVHPAFSHSTETGAYFGLARVKADQ